MCNQTLFETTSGLLLNLGKVVESFKKENISGTNEHSLREYALSEEDGNALILNAKLVKLDKLVCDDFRNILYTFMLYDDVFVKFVDTHNIKEKRPSIFYIKDNLVYVPTCKAIQKIELTEKERRLDRKDLAINYYDGDKVFEGYLTTSNIVTRESSYSPPHKKRSLVRAFPANQLYTTYRGGSLVKVHGKRARLLNRLSLHQINFPHAPEITSEPMSEEMIREEQMKPLVSTHWIGLEMQGEDVVKFAKKKVADFTKNNIISICLIGTVILIFLVLVLACLLKK